MMMRASSVAALVLALGLALAAASAAPPSKRPAGPQASFEPMTFFVVKGAPDSCGHGCDSWIEAEGKIEGATGARFKAFLDRQHGRNLPIYLYSPGGSLNQAIVMGNLLHAKQMVAGIGRTSVQECGFEAQDSDVCLKVKQSGRELHGSLVTRAAMCASACPYVFVGAAVHEVAPDAVLGVHSPKMIFNFHGAPRPDAAVIAIADQRGHERADRMVATYLAKMGIDEGLMRLALTVKFEDMHFLTREEIVRFGIDRREFVETPWVFESERFSVMHKIALARPPGGTSFQPLQWIVFCIDTNHFMVDFVRPMPASPTYATMSIAGLDAKPVYFSYPPARTAGREQWGLRIPRPVLQSLLDRPQIEFTESALGSDGQRVPQTVKLSNEGWAGAFETLQAACPPAKDTVASHATADAAAAK